jgi:putative transposase
MRFASFISPVPWDAVEDLQVKEMSIAGGTRKRGLNRSMADAALGKFLELLTSKAEEAGCEIVRVTPRGTTQECSWCGQTVPKTLYDRVHSCPDCGLTLDRDHNAAINVQRLQSHDPAKVQEDPLQVYPIRG